MIDYNPMPVDHAPFECHGLDTQEQVFFYEQDFYVLSNFSAFAIEWRGKIFPTVEHAYHYEKFEAKGFMGSTIVGFKEGIRNAPSAHQAFKLGQINEGWRRSDWDDVKVEIMHELLRAKVEQHEYVWNKLLATGNRELVENSWRDDFWGWGPNQDGKNMLGKTWMKVRDEAQAGELFFLKGALPRPNGKCVTILKPPE